MHMIEIFINNFYSEILTFLQKVLSSNRQGMDKINPATWKFSQWMSDAALPDVSDIKQLLTKLASVLL